MHNVSLLFVTNENTRFMYVNTTSRPIKERIMQNSI